MHSAANNPEFEALLEYIKNSRGFDFTGYKRLGLIRRFQRRMQANGIDSYGSYTDYLQVYPEEFTHLFNTILINVTSFFRDRVAWDYIKTELVPQILAAKSSEETIRIWSAGCASGEEAYTIAMVMADVMGVDRFCERVKIYATDVDEEILEQARHATYTARDIAKVPPEFLAQYFDQSEQYYTFRKHLRHPVVFGRHNLVQDAPISRIDLLLCRNTLMYFNAETQTQILNRFHFAIQNQGFLFLGKAEMLLTHAEKFSPIDLKQRIFTKVSSSLYLHEPFIRTLQPVDSERVNVAQGHLPIREIAFDSSPVAQIVIDLTDVLVLANETARKLFGISSREIGRPLRDLELSYRPIELRSCIDQVYEDRHPVNVRNVMWTTASDEVFYLDIQVSAQTDRDNNLLAISVTFTDVTCYKRLQEELKQSNQELEMAYEELQSTNEELETTNEELQSTVEELETTNEELQSTNEELETMNEELQSTNEELQTINEELRERSGELNQSNTLLGAILTSLQVGVVVLNRDLQIQIWNYKAEDLWGLQANEVRCQPFFNLDIGLPVENLRQPIRNCLAGEPSYEAVLSAINRRGREIQCKVTVTPLAINRVQQIEGVVLLMEAQNTPG